jgi:SAM-dependent methyltransferase
VTDFSANARVHDRRHGALLSGDLAQRLIAGADLPADAQVLDVGAGTGRVAIPLASFGRRIVAIDPSAAMLQQLRGKAAGRLSRAIADAGALDRALVDRGMTPCGGVRAESDMRTTWGRFSLASIPGNAAASGTSRLMCSGHACRSCVNGRPNTSISPVR